MHEHPNIKSMAFGAVRVAFNRFTVLGAAAVLVSLAGGDVFTPTGLREMSAEQLIAAFTANLAVILDNGLVRLALVLLGLSIMGRAAVSVAKADEEKRREQAAEQAAQRDTFRAELEVIRSQIAESNRYSTLLAQDRLYRDRQEDRRLELGRIDDAIKDYSDRLQGLRDGESQGRAHIDQSMLEAEADKVLSHMRDFDPSTSAPHIPIMRPQAVVSKEMNAMGDPDMYWHPEINAEFLLAHQQNLEAMRQGRAELAGKFHEERLQHEEIRRTLAAEIARLNNI